MKETIFKDSESGSVVSDPLWHGLYSPRNSPGQNTGVGSLSLLQGIFPTQGLNPDLPHHGWTLYQLSHKGSLSVLEWVAYLFSCGSSWPRNWTRVSCIAGEFFTNRDIREVTWFKDRWYPKPVILAILLHCLYVWGNLTDHLATCSLHDIDQQS